MARHAKVSYDRENDILYLYTGKKAKDSLEIDKFVIDIAGADVVGIEISDASVVLSEITQSPISKGLLSKLEAGSIKMYRSKELVYIMFALFYKAVNKTPEVKASVPAPVAVMAVRN